MFLHIRHRRHDWEQYSWHKWNLIELKYLLCSWLQCCNKYCSYSLSSNRFSPATFVLLLNAAGLSNFLWIHKYSKILQMDVNKIFIFWKGFFFFLRFRKRKAIIAQSNEWVWCCWTMRSSFSPYEIKLPPACLISGIWLSAVWKAI